MANQLISSHLVKGALDTTTTVANQVYQQKALDQIIGARSGTVTDEYDEDNCSLVTGVPTLASYTPHSGFSFFKTGYTVLGTEPPIPDTLSTIYVKMLSHIGTADSIIVYASAQAVAQLHDGEGIMLNIDCPVGMFTIYANAYSEDVNEATIMVGLAKLA